MTVDTAAAEAVVQAQLDAYNAKDIEAFMRCWSEDAQFFAHPDTLLADGAAAIRARHLVRFQEANLFGRLISRMAVGDAAGATVVDREIVSRTFPEGPGQVDVIAIYRVAEGKITRAWFAMGEPRLG